MQGETTPPEHDDSLPYLVTLQQYPELTGWQTIGPDPHGQYAVSGPCPVCFGDATGGQPTPVAMLAAVEPGPVMALVPSTCNCGDSHPGNGGSTGCGRSWMVVVRGTGPAADVFGGALTQSDLEASRALQQVQTQALPAIRQRAASWIAGLTAATGVVGTATIIRGSGSFADLPSPWRWTMGVASAVAVLALFLGIVLAYRAAYGRDVNVEALAANAQRPGKDLNLELIAAVRSDVDGARRHLGTAVVLTLVAVVALTVATFASWQTATSATSICTGQGLVAQTSSTNSSTPDVGSTSATTVKCVPRA